MKCAEDVLVVRGHRVQRRLEVLLDLGGGGLVLLDDRLLVLADAVADLRRSSFHVGCMKAAPPASTAFRLGLPKTMR